jgi:hypothetical protein
MGNNCWNIRTFYTEHDGNRGLEAHFRLCLPQEEIDLLRELVSSRDIESFSAHVRENWSHFFEANLYELVEPFFHSLVEAKTLEIETEAIPFEMFTIDPAVPPESGGPNPPDRTYTSDELKNGIMTDKSNILKWHGKETPTVPSAKVGAYRHQNLRRSGLYVYLKVPVLPKDVEVVKGISSLDDFEKWLMRHEYFYEFAIKKEVKRLYKAYCESRLEEQVVAPNDYERYSLLAERDDIFPHLH